MPSRPAPAPWMARGFFAADPDKGIPASPFGDGLRLILVIRVGRRHATLYYPSAARAWLMPREAFDRMTFEPVAFSKRKLKRTIRERLRAAKISRRRIPRRLMQHVLERV